MRIAAFLAASLAAYVATAEPVTMSGRDIAANDTRTAHRRAQLLRVPIIVVENVLLTLPPTIYYWGDWPRQTEDWELGWSWDDWQAKLFTLDPLVLDTNRFEANAMRHPLAGALAYQIGRANGLGILGATLVDLANALLWEYLVEFRERPSFNDLIANTASGFLIGEPLFLIGNLSERGSWARRGLGLIASPFHHVQRAIGLSSARDASLVPHRLVLILGSNVVAYDGGTPMQEARVGLDLELMRDRRFGQPGARAGWTGAAAWNRVALDLQFGGVADDGLAGGRFRSFTTFGGRSEQSIGEDGLGRTTFIGLGTGFEVMGRHLPAMLDRFAVFQLVNPRFGGWWRTAQGDVDIEIGASGDVAMVQSLVRATQPLQLDSSIVLTRGYYYATGVSAHTRIRARYERWSLELESTARQFWSYDDHSYGGDGDPKGLVDRRAVVSGALGVRPLSAGIRIELVGAAIVRSGAAGDQHRQSAELGAGLAVNVPF